MRNTTTENLAEHSMQTAIVAHALAVIGNRRLGARYNAERAALLALYHDAGEIITGDLPTPIKNYNDEIRGAYKRIEDMSKERIFLMLPEDLRDDYKCLLFNPDDKCDGNELRKLVKAADKLCAYIKSVEELKAGNGDFRDANVSIYNTLINMQIPEVDIFIKEFLPAFSMTIDEFRTER